MFQINLNELMNDYPKGRFSKLLRESRHAKEMTVKTLAKQTNLSERYINYLEKGSHEPSLEIFHNIAAALGIPPKDMIDRLNAG